MRLHQGHPDGQFPEPSPDKSPHRKPTLPFAASFSPKQLLSLEMHLRPTPLYTSLADAHISFVAGALNIGDSDHTLALRVAAESLGRAEPIGLDKEAKHLIIVYRYIVIRYAKTKT